MKKLKILVFSLIIVFSFCLNIRVFAVSCNNGNTVTIEQKGISPAGFIVKMPKCEMVRVPGKFVDVGANDLPTFSAAIEAGHEYITQEGQYDAENKSATSTSMPRCIDPEATITFTVTCEATAPEAAPVDSVAMEQKSGKTTGGGSTIPSGFTEDDCTYDSLIEYYNCSKTTYWYECPKNTTDNGAGACCPMGSHADGGICCPNDYDNMGGKCCSRNSSNIGGTCMYTSKESKTFTFVDNPANRSLNIVKNLAWYDIADWGDNGPITCHKDFTLRCPLYRCEEKDLNVVACSPDYVIKSTGEDAYCVNPSQPFPKGGGKTAEYIADEDFNVSNCSNSFSTVDCGYANILVEAAYNKSQGTTVSNDAINIGLRLWGAHSTQRGYERTGIANVIGDTCSEWGFFLNLGNGVNVYKYTEKYIRVTMKEKFYDVAQRYDYIPPSGKKLGESFGKITCAADYNSDLLGIMCGDNSAYRQGFDLFFNTLIGNSEFKNHLALLFGGAVDSEPDDMDLVVVDKETGETEFVLQYEEFGDIDTQDVVFDCDNLTGVSASDRAKIEPYCRTRVFLYDENGHKLTDEDGNPLTPEDGLKIDKCIKGSGCITKTFRYAVCKESNQPVYPIYAKLKYYKSKANRYIKKYQSCANANTNQVLFAFLDDDNLAAKVNTPTKIEEEIITRIGDPRYIFNLSCTPDGYCNETEASKTSTSGDFKSCENDESLAERGNTFTSTIRDPSLKCIINMPESTKNYYDYSTYFGVNSNFCRVYCSDEVDYTFTNRINATAGETFSFDLIHSIDNDIIRLDNKTNATSKDITRKNKLKSYQVNNSNHMISSIISEKRTCVSQIYYSIDFPTKINWEKTYGITNDDIEKAYKDTSHEGKKTINNISQLLTVLVYKSSQEQGRTEVINKVLFDLFNCYFLEKENFSHLSVPKDTDVENVYDNIQYLYGRNNNYGFDDIEGADKCTLTNEASKQRCIDMQSVQYMFGAEYNDEQRITQVTLDPDSDSVKTHISNVRYCSNNSCMSYSSLNKEANYDYSGFINVDNISYINGPNGYKIPNYNYALFDVGVNVALYNNMKFQTKPGSGYITNVTDSRENKNYITLDSYKYPLSKNALTILDNDCAQIAEDSRNITKRCTINYVLGATVSTPMIHTFYRKNKIDNFYSEINSSDNRFACTIDVKIPKISSCNDCTLKDATIYRNVTPDDLFPNNFNYENTNWATVEGQVAKNYIETTADGIRISDDDLDYSVSLSSKQILAIREYDSYNRDYMKEDIYNCTKEDDMYLDCRSTFMDILRGSTTTDSDLYGTIDPKYNGSKYFNSN